MRETEPLEDGAAPGPSWFLNGVVQIETNIAPKSLLEICREIERALGRDQDNRKGPRTLDLDVLLYDDCILAEPALTVPHPRLHQRRFVLTPLVELDPERRHENSNGGNRACGALRQKTIVTFPCRIWHWTTLQGMTAGV